MIYTKITKMALKLCFEAHKDQIDKSDMPYVFHPFHLAEQMKDEETTAVALLHDVIEDTDYTAEDLRNMGFPEKIVSAIELLTHDDSVPYMDYVRLVKKNKIAAAVKRADLMHNSDMSRLETVDDYAIKRAEKYRQAIKILDEE